MDDPPVRLSYATPDRRDRWWRRLWRDPVGSDRSAAAAQLVLATVVLLAAVCLFGRSGYSAGPWPTRLAWAWLPIGAAVLNAAAAVDAHRGARRGGPAAARAFRRYFGATLGNVGAVIGAVAVVAHWPSYVIIDPFAPPVNDRLYVFDPELYVKAPAWLLVVNPLLFLLLTGRRLFAPARQSDAVGL